MPRLPSLKPLTAALAPTPWLLLALTLVLAVRGYDWVACGLWRELPPAREAIKGIAWDLALLCACFSLQRAVVAAARAPAGWPVRALAWLVPLLFGLCTVARLLDALHCRMAGAHWGADSFQYLDAGFAGSVWEPRYGGALLAFLVVAGLAALLVHRDARAVTLRPGLGALGLALPLLLALPAAAWAVRDGWRYPPQVQEARLIPEVNLLVQWQRAGRTPVIASHAPPLAPDLARKFTRLGLLPGADAADPAWPLLRRHIDPEPLGVATRPGVAPRPNVVITLLESQNALFVHGLSGRYPGLMPELSALTQKLTVFSEFYNTSAPTIAAMVTALCSVHPTAHPRDLGDGKTVDGQAAYTCLPDLLRGMGYHTVFVQAAAKTVTAKEYFLRTHGFDEVFGLEDLAPLYRDRPQGAWGPHDAELVDFATGKMRALEAERRATGRPFLLVMLTLDTHTPGMAGPACKLPPGLPDVPDDAEAQTLLASYHCSDRALGTLGRFVLAPERRDQTLWLLTADHAAFADMTPPSVYLRPENHRHSTQVPMLLHDPLHELPPRITTLAETRDVAPTLAHLLGVPDQPVSLSGWSIFGRRPQLPLLIGRVGERIAFLRTADVAVERTVASVRGACDRREVLLSALGEDVTACDLLAWLAWQDALWAGRRLFPAWLYHGADGVDRAWLVERQERARSAPAPSAAGHE